MILMHGLGAIYGFIYSQFSACWRGSSLCIYLFMIWIALTEGWCSVLLLWSLLLWLFLCSSFSDRSSPTCTSLRFSLKFCQQKLKLYIAAAKWEVKPFEVSKNKTSSWCTGVKLLFKSCSFILSKNGNCWHEIIQSSFEDKKNQTSNMSLAFKNAGSLHKNLFPHLGWSWFDVWMKTAG